MSCLLSQSIAAEEEPVSLAFLEFLGGMVEAENDYITPMELYEYENLASESGLEEEPAQEVLIPNDQNLDEVAQ